MDNQGNTISSAWGIETVGRKELQQMDFVVRGRVGMIRFGIGVPVALSFADGLFVSYWMHVMNRQCDP